MSIPLLSPGEGDGFDLPDSAEEFDLDEADFESHGLTTNSYVHRRPVSWSQSLWKLLTLPWRALWILGLGKQKPKQVSHRRSVRYWICGRRLPLIVKYLLLSVITFVILTATLWPSYNDPPAHYGELRKRILGSSDDGRANGGNQKIFIAASIYDKGDHLASGRWSNNILDLVDLLGPTNVFLSIYENEGGPEAQEALKLFEGKLHCHKSLVYEERLPLSEIAKIALADGTQRVKRIAYLAEVRNRALKPLEEPTDVVYDKILFLNDVLFNPVDAVQLLFSTNADEEGKAFYKAACAVDFINPFKFYDTFATRDLEGYSMGLPFFPWYSSAGGSFSRQDVLDGLDAVRVKSCWGGMVAFDASFFQARQKLSDATEKDTPQSSSPVKPIRFRAVPDPEWEASECCLVHADILSASASHESNDTGVYQNPYVRVAYGPKTLWWLPITRRFERLYTIPHTIINRLVGLPWYNPRRIAKDSPDSKTSDEITENSRLMGDGYCGMRTLQLMRESRREGEKNWETVPLPPA